MLNVLVEQLLSSSSSDEKNDDKKFDPEYLLRREEKKLDFITNHVVSTVDAVDVSDYAAARVLTAVAQGLGFELKDLTVSRSTIRRRRRENERNTATTIKTNFKVFQCSCNDC